MKLPSPYLKMRVLGAIDYAQGTSIKKRIQDVASMTFLDEDGNPRQFTWRTISTWFYRYKIRGITGIQQKTRSDKGQLRKVTPEELLEAINQVLPYFRGQKYNKMEIFRKIIEKGILSSTQIAQTTFYRFIKEHELLSDKDLSHNKRRMAFSMQYANQLWQADTMYGPYVKNPQGKHIQTKLLAFIDDASRLICHGQFFFNENIDSLTASLKSAFYKRGVPEQLYVDNGGIYTSAEITLICARLGCILRHAPVRDGAAKGKIERFFRRVRDQFLNRVLDLSNLATLNKQFNEWVENDYNSTSHSAIGMKPVDRFNMDIKRINFLPPSPYNDEIFYNQETRKVKKDNTFSFSSVRYETPADLRDKTIEVRFDRNKKDKVIIYYKNQRIGQAKVLDLVANGLLRRNTHKEVKL